MLGVKELEEVPDPECVPDIEGVGAGVGVRVKLGD